MFRTIRRSFYSVIENMDLKRKLTIMCFVIIVPLALITVFLLVMLGRHSASYDSIVDNIAIVNTYNISFKKDMDSVMYQMVARSLTEDEVEDALDLENPEKMIDDAEESFRNLETDSLSSDAAQISASIFKLLETLRTHVKDINSQVKISGSYESNMEKLDTDIRIITDLIQDRIAEYLSYETESMELVKSQMQASTSRFIRIVFMVLAAVLVLTIFLSVQITRSITVPIGELCGAAEEIGRGHFDTRTDIAANNELAVLGNSINHMAEEITDLVEDIKTEQINNKDMELRLLQSQINPHFLYNTLDNIIWLAEEGRKDDIESIVMSLSQFFRTTLSGGRDIISLREELSHVEAYLQIQRFRYREILSYELDVPESLLSVPIIKMTLQPIVENALYHGIKNKRGMGTIRITGCFEDTGVAVSVSDDGIGMKNEELERLRRIVSGTEKASSDSEGFGLSNVDQRIKLNFGPEYGISIRSAYMVGTTVTVHIPEDRVK